MQNFKKNLGFNLALIAVAVLFVAGCAMAFLAYRGSVDSALKLDRARKDQRQEKKRNKAGKRKPTNSNKADLHLGETNATLELRSASLIDGQADQTLENPPLDAKSINGFMRMALPRDFGHAAFPAENTRALIGLAGGLAFWLLGMPAPWLAGSMMAAIIAVFSRVRIGTPDWLRAQDIAMSARAMLERQRKSR